MGMAGSEGYDTEEHEAMRPQERIEVAGYDLVYDDLKADHGANFTAVTADISVYKDDELLGKLHPARAYYSASGQNTSEVDVRRTLGGDLYLALTNVDTQSRLINVTVLVKPLINWIWIGCIISMVGTVLVMVTLFKRRVAGGQETGAIL
jgi:cytochrome c-type biogenesis protein CcmF